MFGGSPLTIPPTLGRFEGLYQTLDRTLTRLRLAAAFVASAVRCTVDISRPGAAAVYVPVQLVDGCGSDGDDDR
jgi:hypothetical protein